MFKGNSQWRMIPCGNVYMLRHLYNMLNNPKLQKTFLIFRYFMHAKRHQFLSFKSFVKITHEGMEFPCYFGTRNRWICSQQYYAPEKPISQHKRINLHHCTLVLQHIWHAIPPTVQISLAQPATRPVELLFQTLRPAPSVSESLWDAASIVGYIYIFYFFYISVQVSWSKRKWKGWLLALW